MKFQGALQSWKWEKMFPCSCLHFNNFVVLFCWKWNSVNVADFLVPPPLHWSWNLNWLKSDPTGNGILRSQLSQLQRSHITRVSCLESRSFHSYAA